VILCHRADFDHPITALAPQIAAIYLEVKIDTAAQSKEWRFAVL